MFGGELLEILLKGLGGGIIGFFAQKFMKRAEQRLKELQSRPLEETDQNLEEILGHLIEDQESLKDPRIQDSLQMARKELAIIKAYLLVRIEEIGSQKNRPGGL